MVAEIVTNAVRYRDSGEPGGGVRVSVLVSSKRIRVEIKDDGRAQARPVMVARQGAWGESGRGLMVVDGLADEWGTSTGATVWFEAAG